MVDFVIYYIVKQLVSMPSAAAGMYLYVCVCDLLVFQMPREHIF